MLLQETATISVKIMYRQCKQISGKNHRYTYLMITIYLFPLSTISNFAPADITQIKTNYSVHKNKLGKVLYNLFSNVNKLRKYNNNNNHNKKEIKSS